MLARQLGSGWTLEEALLSLSPACCVLHVRAQSGVTGGRPHTGRCGLSGCNWVCWEGVLVLCCVCLTTCSMCGVSKMGAGMDGWAQ